MNNYEVIDTILGYSLKKLLPEPRIIISINYASIIQSFQDLRYIGELRQRWEEIKKLQLVKSPITSS